MNKLWKTLLKKLNTYVVCGNTVIPSGITIDIIVIICIINERYNYYNLYPIRTVTKYEDL